MLRSLPRVLLVICAFALMSGKSPADTFGVMLDQARILKLPDRVATIIIGNPSIADATLQSGGLLVVTAKGYGVTNLMALDNRGNILVEHTIQVTSPRSALTVYRGTDRESLSCTPNCERTLVPGDSAAVFDSVVGQIGVRNGISAGNPAAAAPKQ